MKKRDNVKTVVRNRRARHDYIIEEVIEAGIALIGTEVKSLRAGRASLQDAYAQVVDGEVFLKNAHIDQYEPAARFNHDPLRPRRLLLHKREIRKLASRVAQRGYTLVPLSIYFRDGKAKVELALARGKKSYDKREAIRERDLEREARRAVRQRDY
ncbi:MAG: SsrA-binding protein SmpB [Bacillota bacterium]|jgi:SsrA-binding protein|nr:SsrA-binding protein SmpB [Candidatus Fermentithermobacillaceae bacterium]HAF66253.1 SsrA-binding protein [Clostridiales bacterium UBA9857]HOA71112.1 SsrA-binding protein SmpB [Bacillota bacterium]HPT36042.1 SsrA-binding protein SmpB [Bacillota bacterium]HPZ85574.1 SsrA-binding protein SmpB [Bacillota bacterium]